MMKPKDRMVFLSDLRPRPRFLASISLFLSPGTREGPNLVSSASVSPPGPRGWRASPLGVLSLLFCSTRLGGATPSPRHWRVPFRGGAGVSPRPALLYKSGASVGCKNLWPVQSMLPREPGGSAS